MDLIIFHKNCPDGFCAAFIAKKKYPEARLLGCTYGESTPYEPVRAQDVLVVDFSWPREQVEELRAIAKSLFILDHHKTAEANLAGLPYAVFDMNRSGAALTWDRLFSGPRPWYVDYVQDRDLWTWALKNSKEVNAYIMALPHTIEAWSELDEIDADAAAFLGKGCRKQVEHYIEKVAAQAQMGKVQGVGSVCSAPGLIREYSIAVVNAPYTNISDVLNELCKQGYDIGLGWFERKDGWMQFSLRSIGEIDVSAIAKNYGGGGHRNAAGFELNIVAGRQLVDTILGREEPGFDWEALQKLRSAPGAEVY